MSQKEKFALYLTPEMKARLERRYQEDGSRSLTGFIENAINFYLDYLSANNAGMFLPVSVQSYLDGRLDQLEKRVSSLLFKQAVELDQGVSVLADCVHLDEEYLRKKHAESVARVKKLNGICSWSRWQSVRRSSGTVMMDGKTDHQESVYQVWRWSRCRRLPSLHRNAGTGGDHPG